MGWGSSSPNPYANVPVGGHSLPATGNPMSPPNAHPATPIQTTTGSPGSPWGNMGNAVGTVANAVGSVANQSQAQGQPTGPQTPGEGYGPGFGEQYGQSHVGAYDQPTMLEQFAQQQMQGNNPYYQRLQQQQADQINQQMAARGHYNSGGALSALGNASGALYADQFQNMGNLVGQASNLGLQRQQQGFGQAAGVQQLQQNRLQNQFGDAYQMAALGAGLYGGFYGQGGAQSGDAAMSGINANANAAQLTGQGQQATTNTFADLIKAGIAG